MRRARSALLGLTAATLLAAGCAERRSSPPNVARVTFHASRYGLLVELNQLENTASGSVEVCMDNVVVMGADGAASSAPEGRPSCSFSHTGPCYVVSHHEHATANILFRAPIQCPGVDPAKSVVMADVRWREWPGAARWHTITLFDTPGAVDR